MLERMNVRRIGTAVHVVLLLVVMTALASVAWPLSNDDPRVGTWELNLAKSTFRPGPPPIRQTITFQAAGPHWSALLQGVDASGHPINPEVSNLEINFDGNDHPTPAMDYDTSAWKQINATTYEVIRKKAGKVVLTSMNVVSKDGMTMTITTKGHNAAGQTIFNVRVYDKR
jgi:hypothetical protein